MPDPILDQLVNNALPGGAPAAPAAPGAAPAAPPPPDPAAARAAQGDKIQKEAAPKTEADASDEPAMEFFKVKVGEEEREFTPQQIAGMHTRYSSLNRRWQDEIAPYQSSIGVIHKLAETARAQGHNVTDEGMAQFLVTALRNAAGQKNVQMGANRDPRPGDNVPAGTNDIEAELAAWEEENAIKLPPALRSIVGSMPTLQAQNEQLRRQLATLAQQGQALAAGARDEVNAAGKRTADALRQRVGVNLARAQQALGLPDEAEREFMMFAQARGYVMEDFVDPRLTMTVAQDFANNRNAPEMERLRKLHERRQAFTGAGAGAPGVSGDTPAKDFNSSFIDKMAATKLGPKG